MKNKLVLSILLFLIICNSLIAQDNKDDNPLKPFTRLIGGEWHLEGTYQVFEWGVGKKSVRSKSYFPINGEDVLVSEGSWFWHPGQKKIKGLFTAIQMPVELFDYSIIFEGNTVTGDLRAYSSAGVKSEYIETWEFTDNDTFIWTLYSQEAEGKKKIMGGKYERKGK